MSSSGGSDRNILRVRELCRSNELEKSYAKLKVLAEQYGVYEFGVTQRGKTLPPSKKELCAKLAAKLGIAEDAFDIFAYISPTGDYTIEAMRPADDIARGMQGLESMASRAPLVHPRIVLPPGHGTQVYNADEIQQLRQRFPTYNVVDEQIPPFEQALDTAYLARYGVNPRESVTWQLPRAVADKAGWRSLEAPPRRSETERAGLASAASAARAQSRTVETAAKPALLEALRNAAAHRLDAPVRVTVGNGRLTMKLEITTRKFLECIGIMSMRGSGAATHYPPHRAIPLMAVASVVRGPADESEKRHLHDRSTFRKEVGMPAYRDPVDRSWKLAQYPTKLPRVFRSYVSRSRAEERKRARMSGTAASAASAASAAPASAGAAASARSEGFEEERRAKLRRAAEKREAGQ